MATEPRGAQAHLGVDRHVVVTDGPSGPRRRADIQGLRAVAVLSVIVFHATSALPGGFVGVDVFFVVSGFVITAMLAREWASGGRINFARFYVRRFKRLTPALMLVLAFTLIGTALVLAPMGAGDLSPQETVAVTAVGAVFLSANLVIARTTGAYFDAEATTNPLLHTWSLSVEEQFYLFFPALLGAAWMTARHRSWRSSAAVLVAVVGAGSLLLALLGAWGDSPLPDTLVGFYGPATRVWEFAAGALLALLHRTLVLRSVRIATVVGSVGAAALLTSLWMIGEENPYPGPWTLLPVIATMLLITAGTQGGNYITRGLSARPMVVVGDLSYSLYLWHWPFIAFAVLLWPGSVAAPRWATVLSLVPAVACYHLVEQPIRNSEWHGPRLLRLATVAVFPPLLLSAGIFAAVATAYGDETVRRYQVGIGTSHLSSAAGCMDQSWRNTEDCTWNAHAEGAPIYLVGDSNADHFSEALHKVSEAEERPLRVVAQVGCTYARVTFSSVDPSVTARCQGYVDGAEQDLSGAERGTVVIANSYLWWAGSSDVAVGVPGRAPTSDPIQRLAVLEIGLAGAVQDLVAAGHEVLIVQPVPHWGDGAEALSWAGCSVLHIRTRGCVQSQPLDDARYRQGLIWAVVQRVAEMHDAQLVDFSPEICPRRTCKSESEDGRINYRDGTHISVAQSEALAGGFAKALARRR